MKSIVIQSVPGFAEWRQAARECLSNEIPPGEVLWRTGTSTQHDLLADDVALSDVYPAVQAKNANPEPRTVPGEFLQNAEAAACHSQPQRYDLLYRLLWRICHENRHLLKLKTDNDVLQFDKMIKAVRRDAYKITAFLRFRKISQHDAEHFVAWYEPEHYTLERVLPFFQTRFKNMRWSILTPYRAAHWDGEHILLQDNPDPALFPQHDQIEQYWLTYYASIFNPARPKKQAMLAQMPKKYWKNMPETKLVDDLMKTSATRTQRMIAGKADDDV